MRETEFINRNREKWERYEQSLQESDADPERLHQLFVQTTDDLSISRTFYPSRSVRVYLNGLAQRTFLEIYRGRRGGAHRLLSFWTDSLPRTVFERRRPMFVALLVFVLSMGIGVLSYRIDPIFAETILGADYVEMTEANIESGDPMAVYKSRDAFGMSLHITLNNILVAFLTFIAGAFFCVGTIVLLVRNGVMVGVFQYFFFDRGEFSALPLPPALDWAVAGLSRLLTAGGSGLEQVLASVIYLASDEGVFRESLLTIWIHGALEISSIAIAGGAGLTLGSGLLFPGTLSRLQAFGRSARAGLKIMLGTVPLFVVAGFLEGYVTRQTQLPEWLRLLFILLCFAFILWYYVIYPRTVGQRPPPASAAMAREPRDVNAVVPDLLDIRTLGEQMSLTFLLVRRGLGRLVVGSLGVAAAFTALSFAFGGEPMERYEFVSYFLGDLENFHRLLASFGRGREVTYLLLVAGSFYLLFHLALSVVYRYTELERRPPVAARELLLLLAATLLALSFAFDGTLTALITFLTMPLLIFWAMGAYAYGLTPRRAFRLTYTNLGSSYGLIFLLLLIALPLAYLFDTTVGTFFFQFLDWVLYTDGSNIDARNVLLQAFCYFFLWSLVFTVAALSAAVALGSLQEVETAAKLRQRIAALGGGRRTR